MNGLLVLISQRRKLHAKSCADQPEKPESFDHVRDILSSKV